MRALSYNDWVLYARTPLAGTAAVLDGLARYTHRTAIGNDRLMGIDGDKVLLLVRADDHGGKRCVTFDGRAVHRPAAAARPATGLQAHRYYGLPAPTAEIWRLALARQLLAVPAANHATAWRFSSTRFI